MKITGIKELLLMFVLFSGLFLLWLGVGFGGVEEDYYLSNKVLEMSTPFNVTINLDQIRPAYEQ